jgi:hypothetical protein
MEIFIGARALANDALPLFFISLSFFPRPCPLYLANYSRKFIARVRPNAGDAGASLSRRRPRLTKGGGQKVPGRVSANRWDARRKARIAKERRSRSKALEEVRGDPVGGGVGWNESSVGFEPSGMR